MGLEEVRRRAMALVQSGHFSNLDEVKAALSWEGVPDETIKRAFRGGLVRQWLRLALYKYSGRRRWNA
jgi:hypothetical protein